MIGLVRYLVVLCLGWLLLESYVGNLVQIYPANEVHDTTPEDTEYDQSKVNKISPFFACKIHTAVK